MPSGYLTGISRPGTEPSNDKKTVLKSRGSVFPYDKPTEYGQPVSTDMSDGGAYHDMSLNGHGYQLTPKDTNNTVWDDDTGAIEQEAWFPVLFGKSSNGPSAGGFGAIPGTSGGWANSPKGNDMEGELKRKFERPKKESVWDELTSMLGMEMPEEEPEHEPVPNITIFFLGDESPDEDHEL